MKSFEVKDADLAFEVFYVGDDVVGAGFVDSEFVFVHSELLHHFHEGIYCEGVVLHGNTEFLLGMFFGNVFGFDQFVLLYHLAGIAQEFLSLRGDGNSTVPALRKSSTPISSSSSRIAEDKLGCDIKDIRASSIHGIGICHRNRVTKLCQSHMDSSFLYCIFKLAFTYISKNAQINFKRISLFGMKTVFSA